MLSLARPKTVRRRPWPFRRPAAPTAPRDREGPMSPTSWLMRLGVLSLAMIAVIAADRPTMRKGGGQDSPVEVRPGQWPDILVGAAREFRDDRVPEVSAGIAY